VKLKVSLRPRKHENLKFETYFELRRLKMLTKVGFKPRNI